MSAAQVPQKVELPQNRGYIRFLDSDKLCIRHLAQKSGSHMELYDDHVQVSGTQQVVKEGVQSLENTFNQAEMGGIDPGCNELMVTSRAVADSLP